MESSIAVSVLLEMGYELPEDVVCALERATVQRRAVRRRLQEKIVIALAQTDPRELGLPFDRWTSRRIGYFLKGAGLFEEVAPQSVHVIVQRALVNHFGKDYISKLQYMEKGGKK